jgi:hypothetical protein
MKSNSFFVVCQRPDKIGATGYLAANYHPSTGVRLILTGIPALRYAYETQADAEKAATQANLPHTIHEGDTKEELDCPSMMVIQPRCN